MQCGECEGDELYPVDTILLVGGYTKTHPTDALRQEARSETALAMSIKYSSKVGRVHLSMVATRVSLSRSSCSKLYSLKVS
jgi:hypothetical protein